MENPGNPGAGKSPNASLSFRYNANNEELEELYQACDDDPPSPQFEGTLSVNSENASPKKLDIKSSSIIDKYFKSMRADKLSEKLDEAKTEGNTVEDSIKSSTTSKDTTSSPMKEYLNRLGKRSVSSDLNIEKEGSNETWKIRFHDFKYKITQAVEDIKSRSVDETREKPLPRDSSISDSEENSVVRDSDQQSVGDTDNQVSSLDSSIQNLSELTQAVTAKVNERESSLPIEKNISDSSDDTHRNMVSNESIDLNKDLLDEDGMMEVESGVEALEEINIDDLGDLSQTNVDGQQPPKILVVPEKVTSQKFDCTSVENVPQNRMKRIGKPKTYFFTFSMMFLSVLLMISYILFPNALLWNGFLIGLWVFYFISSFKRWLLDTYFCDWEIDNNGFPQIKKNFITPTMYTVPSVKEHRPMKKYEGWINHYRFPDYDPYTYHINKTTTAFMKLEGCNLRISYTQVKIPKRALWDEKIDSIVFYQHRLYNLTGARLLLLPKDLVRKRQWSKKYPICVVLSDKEKIQVLEKEINIPEKKLSEGEKKSKDHVEVETSEANTSPEKKKKFVWRKKEKIITHTESETGKEGLRHRLVRKMHRDKRTDSVSTSTDPSEDQADKNVQLVESSFHDHDSEITIKSSVNKEETLDGDIDESELLRIKDLLEEAELEGGAESEWSVHIKESRDRHSRLYLFGRTGRDKHEWYRRLNTAISEANAALEECSTTEERSTSDTPGREVEMAVYKVAEREAIAFAKPTSKMFDTIPDSVTVTSASQPLGPSDWEAYEKTFWPYLFKIIQQPKTPTECQCHTLSQEIAWVNAVLARLIYDVMRDPHTINRVQHRIQRKLNTLKLPSFMSPLVITELSLGSVCPLIERVSGPTCDERGVWLDADLKYDGGAYIALLTQINLMKLKEKHGTPEEQSDKSKDQLMESVINLRTASGTCLFTERQLRERKPAIYDSEVEDSAESSSDDESPPLQPVDSADNLPPTTDTPSTPDSGSSKKKFLRMVDKIATNKYFQQVTDYKYVKRAMEGLSNTDIRLQLEVRGLDGRLAINLPPPPHDRVWIGFRTNPQLILKARPAVGARAVRFAHISNWIEEKLTKEFEKVFVLPNMEDIVIDVMTPTPVQFD